MTRTRAQFGLRARLIAAAATVLALVTMGGLTATPAFAFGNLHLIVIDASTGLAYSEKGVELNNVGGFTTTHTTDTDGRVTLGTVDTGDYIANPTDPAYFRANDQTFTMYDGGFVDHIVVFDKYRVTGSIPAGAGDGHTTATFQQDVGSTWVDQPGTYTIANADGSFALPVPNGPGSYRLIFHPGEEIDYWETPSVPFDVVDTAGSVDIGFASIDASGLVLGTVRADGTLAAIDGATVTATSGPSTYSDTTDVSGAFRIKLPPVDDAYSVSATAPGYLQQWYFQQNSSLFQSLVGVDSVGGYQAAGVDYLLRLDPQDLFVNVLADTGFGLWPFGVDALIYKQVGGLYQPFSSYSSLGLSNFLIPDLAEGSYRMAFTEPGGSTTLPWGSLVLDGTPQSSVDIGGDCYISFDIDAGGPQRTIADVVIDPNADASYCDAPAWLEPTDGEVSGTVSNIDELDHQVLADLYYVSLPWATLYDTAVVDPTTGAYTLQGVRDSGDYFVGFRTDDQDPYLDALLGAGGYSAWAGNDDTFGDFVFNHGIPIDVGVSPDSSGNDVTLEPAAILSGTVLGDGNPVEACVFATSLSDPDIEVCFQSDVSGEYLFKLPVGDSFQLRASAVMGGFSEQFWDHQADSADAAAIGPTVQGDAGTFDFDLIPAPAELIAETNDSSDPSYDFTVHLYADVAGEWEEVAVQTTTINQTIFNENYITHDFGLVEGDYRVRFQDDNGMWLSATTYVRGLTDGTYGTPVSGPTCFIDLPSIVDGHSTVINATFDRVWQTEVCGPEPLHYGDVSGRIVESPHLGDSAIEGQKVHLYGTDNGNSYLDVSAPDGSFTFDDVDDGTYQLVIEARDHVAGEHSYVDYVQDDIIASQGGALGTIALTRFGNITGDISNWDDSTMAGAEVGVFVKVSDPGGDYWEPSAYLSSEVDSSGHFEVPGIDEDGEYAVYILFPFGSDYVSHFIGGGFAVPVVDYTGTAEDDYNIGPLLLDVIEAELITGHVSYNGLPVDGAPVFATSLDDPDVFFTAVTDHDGDYEIKVAPNLDYQVAVFDPRFFIQVWDGLNYDWSTCFCTLPDGDAVEVDTDPVADIDFSLVAADEVGFDLIVDYWDPLYGYSDFNGVDVHLYKAVIDGWEEVDIDTSTPYAFVGALGDGDYRLQFSQGSDWLSIDEVYWSSDLPPYDGTLVPETYDPGLCYYDFENVPHGSYIEVDVTLDTDPSTVGCGPQLVVDYNDIFGTVVDSGSAPIEGQPVDLHDNDTNQDFSTTTDFDGDFLFEDRPQGDYTITFPTRDHVSGEHSYVESSLDFVVAGDDDLGDIPLTRYGNVEGDILNWDDTSMSGTTAQVYLKVTDVLGDHWELSGLEVDVDSSGHFEAPGIPVDGDYSLWLDYPTGFVDSFYDGSIGEPVNIFYGNAELDYSPVDATALTTISGTVRLGTAAFAGVTVEAFSLATNATTTTDASGHYTLAVAAGDTYTLVATKTGYLHEFVDDVIVAYAPLTGVDISMNAFAFEVDSAQAASPADPFVGAQVHLYKKVTGGWQEVAVDAADDFADFARTQIGDYRLRISQGANWLAIDQFQWTNMNNTSETSGASFTDADPDVCYLDFSTSGRGYYIVHTTVLVSSAVTCAAEPAVVTPPSGITGGKKHGGPAVTEEDVTEPTPTPTATPTPEPSDSATPQDEPSASAVPSPTGSGTELGWLWFLAGGFVLLILASGAVFIFRRR